MLPAWSYRTEHVPVPLSVNVEPDLLHDPALENVTLPPGAVAATVKLVPTPALAGACVVTVIACAAFVAFTDSTTCGAALNDALPAWSYRTEHVPVPLVIVNTAPAFVQEPELEKLTAPPGANAATVKPVPNDALVGA